MMLSEKGITREVAPREAAKRARLIEAALGVAVNECPSPGAVGIGVVWMHDQRVHACDWVGGLGREVVTAIPAASTDAVVIALAPTRVAGAVLGRVDVLVEYLTGCGIAAHPVHVFAMREGAMWTCLRGGAGGIVVAAAERSTRSRRFSRRSATSRLAGAGPRLMVAACAAMIAMVHLVPSAMSAPPTGQAGLSTDPHSPGQAGVTAPPRAAGPIARTERPDANSVMVSEPKTSVPPKALGAPSWSSAVESAQTGIEPVLPETVEDTMRFGAVVVARPDVVPTLVAARECAWNEFLSGQGAAAVTQAGLSTADAEAVLGTSTAESAIVPQELVWAQTVAADPQALGSVTDEVTAPVAAIDPQAADTAGAILAQLSSEGR